MKTKVVINPHSGSGTTKGRWPAIEAKLTEAIGPVSVSPTQGVGDGTELTSKALREGYEQIIAVGGDGTINEVVNGFFENGKSINPDAVLAFITMGTGGDFRRTFDISLDVDDAISRIAKIESFPLDIGKVTFVGNDGKPATR